MVERRALVPLRGASSMTVLPPPVPPNEAVGACLADDEPPAENELSAAEEVPRRWNQPVETGEPFPPPCGARNSGGRCEIKSLGSNHEQDSWQKHQSTSSTT